MRNEIKQVYKAEGKETRGPKFHWQRQFPIFKSVLIYSRKSMNQRQQHYPYNELSK